MNLNLRKWVLVSACFSSGKVAWGQDLKREIYRLSTDIQYELNRTLADDSSLQGAIDHLHSALDLLRQSGGGGDHQACVDFVYSKYLINLSENTAMDKAVGVCRTLRDLAGAQLLYEKHFVNLSATAAMDLAAREATNFDLIQKLDSLDFAYKQYFQSLSSTSAASRAASNVGRLRRGQLSCLMISYERRSVTLGPVNAMDKSFEDCH